MKPDTNEKTHKHSVCCHYGGIVLRIRQWFAEREGDDAYATWSAGLLSTALFTINVTSALLIFDLIYFADLCTASCIVATKGRAVLLTVVLFIPHYFGIKYLVEHKSEQFEVCDYTFYTKVYVITSVGLLLFAALVAITKT